MLCGCVLRLRIRCVVCTHLMGCVYALDMLCLCIRCVASYQMCYVYAFAVVCVRVRYVVCTHKMCYVYT